MLASALLERYNGGGRALLREPCFSAASECFGRVIVAKALLDEGFGRVFCESVARVLHWRNSTECALRGLCSSVPLEGVGRELFVRLYWIDPSDRVGFVRALLECSIVGCWQSALCDGFVGVLHWRASAECFCKNFGGVLHRRASAE